MTQQIFSVTKEGDAFYSYSVFGYPGGVYESVPVQYQIDAGQQFWIYHGEGAEPVNIKFSFSITIKQARSEDNNLIFPFQVKLYNPYNNLVKFWEVSGLPNTQHAFNFPHDQPDFSEILQYGWWRCEILFTEPNLPGYIYFTSKSFIRGAQTYEVSLTKRWLGHSFWNVLNAMTPQVGIHGHEIYFTVLKELSDATDIPAVTPIQITMDEISGNAELTSLTIEACSGRELLDAVKAKRDKALADYNSIPEFDNYRRTFAKFKYQAWVEKYEKATEEIQTKDPALRIMPVFSDPRITVSFIVDGDIQIEDAPVIFMSFGQTLNGKVNGFSEVDFKFSGFGFLEELLISIFVGGDYETHRLVNDSIEQAISQNSDLLMKYLFLALNKAAGEKAYVEKIIADDEGWKLTCYNTIKHPNPVSTGRYTAPEPETAGPLDNDSSQIDPPDTDTYKPPVSSTTKPGTAETETHKPPVSETKGEATSTVSTQSSAGASKMRVTSAIDPPVPSEFPEGFEVEGGVYLERLDKIKSLVFIMMENRSFDHFLGDLAHTYPDRDYIGFPIGFTNAKAGNFAGAVPVCPASSLFFPDVNITPISPDHGYSHVMNQISDGNFDTKKLDAANPENAQNIQKLGLMQGFAIDIVTRFNHEGSNMIYPDRPPRFDSPQMIMTYYQKSQLPAYYYIADNFKILDQWFAAHPGPTWPNRIATHTGKLIELENFSITKDKRIGYFKEKTIFDILSRYGVDWVFLESNASIMRIFDKYRIDDTNVIPLHRGNYVATDEFQINDDDLKGLDEVLEKDVLPRVIFIEPRFSDEPPLKKAYDDLAPTDISHGQVFIQKICNKLFQSKHWKDLTLLINYDEHGGFFDHVPPPGTAHSSAGIHVPSIYENPDDPNDKGPECMGVRVPALLVSPYVSAGPGGRVSHTIFDHTSILKTILVHNRDKFPAHVFGSFSERVNKASHLGQALDLDVAREAPGMNIPEPVPGIVPSGKTSYYEKKNIPDDDYHECLRTLFMPK